MSINAEGDVTYRMTKNEFSVIRVNPGLLHLRSTSVRLKESDSFFHCKANYEAASRGAYGALAAGMLSVGREISDAILKGDNFSQILSDIKADERGIRGGSLKKSLRETCPTHHTKYK